MLKTPWHGDGPLIRVEFLRKSRRERITLVLDPEAPEVRSLWAVIEATEIEIAAEALRVREDVPTEFAQKNIGRWRIGSPSPASIPGLSEWAKAHGVEGVVWTALGHNFHKPRVRPTSDEVVAHLRCVSNANRAEVEEYVRYAPPQIATPYRGVIEAALGWTPLEPPKRSG